MIGLCVFAGNILCVVTGMLIGQHIERKEWNQLIKDGKIPAPKK